MKTADEIMGLVEAYVLARCRFHDMSQSFTRQMGADVKSTGDALCAALTASMDWHPMDSAPRDGTRILLCADGLSTVGFWIDEQEDQVDVMGADAGFVDVDYQNFWPGRSFGAEQYQGHGRQPTGWKPLPPPPAEGELR